MTKILTVETANNGGYILRSDCGATIHSTLDELIAMLRNTLEPGK